MTEVLSKDRNYDPMLNYSAENCPPVEVQSEFFRYALLEGAEVTEKPRLVRGPFYKSFVEVMHATDAHIKQVNPAFTAEHVMPMSYQSLEVRQQVSALTREDRRALYAIGCAKTTSLKQLAANSVREQLSQQKITADALDVPFYARQKEDWNNGDGIRGCTNACFRMVFGAITGWLPSQAAVSERLVAQHGSSVVDDSVYSSIYHTEVFQEICDKSVATVELIGADFALIDKLASSMKTKRPEAEVYCTVNLASTTAGEDVWHTCVLLQADNGEVTYHDPSNQVGGAYKKASYDDFLNRWAIAYSRAVLTIAV